MHFYMHIIICLLRKMGMCTFYYTEKISRDIDSLGVSALHDIIIEGVRSIVVQPRIEDGKSLELQ